MHPEVDTETRPLSTGKSNKMNRSSGSLAGFEDGATSKSFADRRLPGSSLRVRDLKALAKDSVDFDMLSWLKTVMPLAEFLLFLVAIMVFIQIGPSDIPRNCGTSLHQRCLQTYVENNGTSDSALTGSSCGAQRVECWRSGFKHMLYGGGDLPEGTSRIDVNALGLPDEVLQEWRPGLEYCICLLTNDGAQNLPTTSDAWRDDTEYFCPLLDVINNGIGIAGLVLACVMVTVKAVIEGEDYNIRRSLPPVALVVFFWLSWSTVVVVMTAHYSIKGGPDTECGMPSSAIFYYVFVIGVMSLVGATYATYVLLRVAWRVYTGKLDDTNTIANVESGHSTMKI